MKNKEIFMGVLLLIFTFCLFFMANNYDKKKAASNRIEEPPMEEEPIISSNYTYYDSKRSIIIGDSRMYGASQIIKEDDILFVAKNGATCDYLWNTAEKETDKILEENPDEHFNIFINLGVNDLNREAHGGEIDGISACTAEMYASYYLKLKEKWAEHNLFIISVNPVDKENMEKGKHKGGTNNDKISAFNEIIKESIDNKDIYYCDIYTELLEEGFESPDGLHYSDNSTRNIIEKTKKCAKTLETEKEKIEHLCFSTTDIFKVKYN